MKQLLPVLTTALLLTSGSALLAQTPKADTDHSANAKAKTKEAVSNQAETHGRIKELTAGQKIVINVDNAPDKTFELNDKDVTVKLAKGLKVGDPVAVNEHSVMGKTKSVSITKHTGGGVTHGDPKPVTR
jgi:hypothetical protein